MNGRGVRIACGTRRNGSAETSEHIVCGRSRPVARSAIRTARTRQHPKRTVLTTFPYSTHRTPQLFVNCIFPSFYTMASTDVELNVAGAPQKALQSAIETPQHTGDAGHGLSTDYASKGGDDNSTEVAHDGAVKAEANVDGASDFDAMPTPTENLNQVDMGADANADVVARTGSTAIPSQQTAEQARDAEIDLEIAEMQPWTGPQPPAPPAPSQPWRG